MGGKTGKKSQQHTHIRNNKIEAREKAHTNTETEKKYKTDVFKGRQLET